MLEPLPGAPAFRTTSVEFLPTASLKFDEGTVGREDCLLVIYDEAGLGGVLRELMPPLIWGLHLSRVQGGEPGATAYARVLATMLTREGGAATAEVVQGLWAEMLLIAQSSDPELLIDAWHEDPDEIYDFSFGAQRLEVKSARGAHRRHRFSSSQLPPRTGLELTVVSVLTQRVAGGQTLWDLHKHIASRVSPAHGAAALGKTLAVVPISALTERAYDSVSASASALFYGGADVPTLHLTQGVLAASWTADLANTNPSLPHGELGKAAIQVS